jgi:hypothetical protein
MHPAAIVTLALLSAREAAAGQVIVYTGDTTGLVDRVASTTGKPATDFRLATLPELLGAEPTRLSTGTFEACAGAPMTPAQFDTALSHVEQTMDARDYDSAIALSGVADQVVLCQDTAFDPVEVSRLLYLRGVALWFNSRPEAARASFRQALRMEPKLLWDNAYPPMVQGDFNAARDEIAAATPVTLAIVPRIAGLMTVDGRAVTATEGRLEVTSGEHLIQIGGAVGASTAGEVVTVRLNLDAGTPASLVVPSAVPESAVTWVADPVLGGELSRLLARVLPPSEGVIVAAGPHLWGAGPELWQGGGTWTKVVPPVVAEARSRSSSPGLVLVGAGGGVFLGGLVLAGTGYAGGDSAVEAASAEGVRYEDWQAAEVQYSRAGTRVGVGWGLMLAGLAAAGGGASTLANAGVRVGPWFLQHGGGLTVSAGVPPR